MNFPMTNFSSLTGGHAAELRCLGFLLLSARGILGWNWQDKTGRNLSAGVPWFLTRERERERDLYHQSRQVIAYTSHRLGTGGSGEHDPKGCLPFSKLICNDFNISLVFAFGLFGDLWVVNQWDINIRNTRGIELWTSARRMYLKRSTNTLSL